MENEIMQGEAATRVEPVFRSRRLGHVNLFVDDMARSTSFYNRVCGLAVEFTELGLKANFLGTGNTPHDVGVIETTKGVDRYGRDGHLQIPAEVAAQVGLNHLAWEVDNEAELVAGYRRARDRGVDVKRLADHQIAHSIYLPDPDGNMNEFYVDTVRDWRSVLHGEMDLITTVWRPDAARATAEACYDPDPEIRHVAAAPFHPRRLTHAVLETHQVDRLETFYRDIAGLEPVFRAPGGDLVLLRAAHRGYRYHLAVVAAGSGAEAGLHHYGLELADEAALGVALRAARDRGLAIEREVETAAKRGVFVRDPDGFRVELYAARGHGAPADPGRGAGRAWRV
jgi:catechol 2,3-dioxygenase